MNEDDRQFVLDNVENINADVRDIDELCCALEHSTIFAVDYIQTFATKLIDLEYKYRQLQFNWNSLREWLEENEDKISYMEDVIDKMNELEEKNEVI